MPIIASVRVAEILKAMPRGQAIPNAGAALFDAADRILARQGPEGITSRALTDEAGVAKGVLHNHFHDLDGFLVSYAVDRIAAAFAGADSLLTQVGKRTVDDNLTDAATELFGSGALTVAALMSSRPGVFARVQDDLNDSGEGFDRLERSFAAYLDAEKTHGRVPDDLDSQMVAFHLIASVHHLFFVHGGQPVQRRQVRRVVASLISQPRSGPSGESH
jgi:AcrR family transcriptional regulator